MCHPPRARSGRKGGAMTDVVIVDSGVANLASIASAFRRLGANVVVTGDEGVVQDAPRVVLPGVGAFGAGLGALRRTRPQDRKSTRLNSSHSQISYAVFYLTKKAIHEIGRAHV